MLHRLEEHHAAQVNTAVAMAEDQRRLLKHSDEEKKDLQDELAAQTEANDDMRKVVEDQKKLLAKRENRVKVGPFCLLFFPSVSAELTVAASLRVSVRLCRSCGLRWWPQQRSLQLLLLRGTKLTEKPEGCRWVSSSPSHTGLLRRRCRGDVPVIKRLLPPHQAQVKDLNEKLQAARESARRKEKSLKGELDRLTSDLQACKRERKRLQDERKEREEEVQELQRRSSTFKSVLQVRSGAAESGAARRRHEGSFSLTDLRQGSSDSSRRTPGETLRSVFLS